MLIPCMGLRDSSRPCIPSHRNPVRPILRLSGMHAASQGAPQPESCRPRVCAPPHNQLAGLFPGQHRPPRALWQWPVIPPFARTGCGSMPPAVPTLGGAAGKDSSSALARRAGVDRGIAGMSGIWGTGSRIFENDMALYVYGNKANVRRVRWRWCACTVPPTVVALLKEASQKWASNLPVSLCFVTPRNLDVNRPSPTGARRTVSVQAQELAASVAVRASMQLSRHVPRALLSPC